MRSTTPAISRALPLLVAVLAIVATAGFVRGGDDTTRIRTTFDDVSPLVVDSYVKVDGVELGRVSAIKLRNGKADVELEIDKTALPIHDDATLTIRAKSILGERYIDLDRGSADAPVMKLPGRIPANRTSKSTDLQDVLNTLDDPTSTATAALLTTLGEGTAGQGKNIDNALKAVAPALNGAVELSAILDEQNDVLLSLIDKVTPVAKAVATDDGKQADRLVASAENALAALTSQRQALDASLQRLPGTLATARTSLREIAGVSTETAATLKGLRPVTDKLPEIAGELQTFSDSADPALSSLQPVLDKAQALIDEAQPLVRDLKPGVAGLKKVSAGARPIVEDLEPRLDVVLEFAKNWALATSEGDGLGQYFKGVVPTTPQALLNIPGLHLPQHLDETGEPISGAGGSADLLADITSKLGGPAAGSSATSPDPQSATGLDAEQEESMLNQLLGGLL